MEDFAVHWKNLREKHGYTLKELSYITKIPLSSLEILEDQNFLSIKPVYAKGFIRNICQLFEVNPQESLNLYSQHTPKQEQAKEIPTKKTSSALFIALFLVLLLPLLKLIPSSSSISSLKESAAMIEDPIPEIADIVPSTEQLVENPESKETLDVLTLSISQPTKITIQIDKKTPEIKELPLGTYTFDFQETISLDIKDTQSTKITWKNETYGPGDGQWTFHKTQEISI